MATSTIRRLTSSPSRVARLPAAPVAFTQTNTTTATTVGADVDVGVLNPADIPGVITAIGTIQTAVNDNRHLLNQIIDILQTAGLATTT